VADVALLDADGAHDRQLVAALTDIVNAAYVRGEKGLWLDGFERTTTDAIGAVVAARELVVAREGERIVGCLRLACIDPATAELGLLAVADDAAGSGIGRALVGFAEELSRERGFSTMRLQLLVPREGTHPFKQRLDAWYRRLGYRVVRREDFAECLPEPARHLAVGCDLVTYERPLRSASEPGG
jgi:GNAT superfamily N-acetyltransferase